MKAPLRLVLLDDHPLFLATLTQVVRTWPGVEVVGTATDPVQFLELVAETVPDVVIVDWYLKPFGGRLLLQRLRERVPSVRIVVLSIEDRPELIREALDVGANGYVNKSDEIEDLRDVVGRVAEGGQHLSTHTLGSFSPLRPAVPILFQPLTTRENEVLDLIVQEYSSPEIAERLFVSLTTVKTHRKNILRKMGFKDSISLVRYLLNLRRLG